MSGSRSNHGTTAAPRTHVHPLCYQWAVLLIILLWVQHIETPEDPLLSFRILPFFSYLFFKCAVLRNRDESEMLPFYGSHFLSSSSSVHFQTPPLLPPAPFFVHLWVLLLCDAAPPPAGPRASRGRLMRWRLRPLQRLFLAHRPPL